MGIEPLVFGGCRNSLDDVHISCFGDPLSILYHDLNLDSYRKAFGKNESKKMVIRWSKLDLLKVVQNAVQLPDGLMD